jgi:hypothetical protein
MGLLAGIAIAFAAVTGRIPGTTEEVTGPRLASRATAVAIEAGLARTEIEDVLVNDDFRELEARYVLRIPRGAVVSRLALRATRRDARRSSRRSTSSVVMRKRRLPSRRSCAPRATNRAHTSSCGRTPRR